MGKKLILTERQLQTVLNLVKEQKFDDMITKYQKEENQTVPLPLDDLKLLLSVGVSWCQGKENHPDCDEIMKIRSKLNLY